MSQYGEYMIAIPCLGNMGIEPVVKESEHPVELKNICKDIF